MKFKKKLLMNSLGVLFVSSLVMVPAFACGTKNDTNSNVDNNDNNNSNNNNNNQTNEDNNNYASVVSIDVANSEKMNGNYKIENTYENGIVQSVGDFIENGDFSKYIGTKEDIKEDILLFFLELSKKYDNLVISNPEIGEILISNKTTNNNEGKNTHNSSDDLILNQSYISLNVNVIISSKKNQTVEFGNQPIDLIKGQSYLLNIKINNQLLKPTINNYSLNSYLSWQVDKAIFSMDHMSWVEKNFSFNEGYFSHAFKYKFSNLTNGYTYFDLENKNKNDAYNINEEELETTVENNIDNSLDTYIKYVDYSTEILNLLKLDLPLDEMLKEISKPVIELMCDAKLIPDTLRNFLIESINGKDINGDINDVPLIVALKDNKKELSEFIGAVLGDNSWENIVESFLNEIDTDMSSEQIDELCSILKEFNLPNELINIVRNDVLGANNNPKTLLEIIFYNYKTILNNIAKLAPNLKFAKTIENLLDILLVNGNNKYQSIYDSILYNNETKKRFMDVLKELVSFGPDIEKMLDILVVDNKNFTKDYLIAFVESLSDFMNGFFEKNEKYEGIAAKYKNLIFSKTIIKEAELNKTDKTISFDFEYVFSLEKEVTLNFQPFKDLFSDESILLLVKELSNQYNLNIDIPTSGIEGVLTGKTIKNLLFNFLPNKIVFGEKDSKINQSKPNNLIFKFTANNNKTWFEPIKSGNDYKAGFSFAYNMNIYHDDPSMYDSFTKDYDSKATEVNSIGLKSKLEYSNFLRSVIENILARDYDVSLITSIATNKVIANTNTYNDSQIYSKYNFNNQLDLSGNGDFIVNNLSLDENNFINVSSQIESNKNYLWKNQTDGNEKLFGKKPIVPLDKFNLIENRLFEFSEPAKDISALSIIPVFNLNLPLHLSISSDLFNINSSIKLDIRIMIATVDLYLPFKIIDLKTNKLVNSIHKNISYFNMNVNAN